MAEEITRLQRALGCDNVVAAMASDDAEITSIFDHAAPKKIAQHLTLIDASLFKKIQPVAFSLFFWGDKGDARTVHLKRYIDRFNQVGRV